MVRIVFNPVVFRLKRWPQPVALAVATVVVFVATWALHAYQSFWLRGSWGFSGPDALFWGILGALVLVNVQLDARRSRARNSGGQGSARRRRADPVRGARSRPPSRRSRCSGRSGRARASSLAGPDASRAPDLNLNPEDLLAERDCHQEVKRHRMAAVARRRPFSLVATAAILAWRRWRRWRRAWRRRPAPGDVRPRGAARRPDEPGRLRADGAGLLRVAARRRPQLGGAAAEAPELAPRPVSGQAGRRLRARGRWPWPWTTSANSS